MGKHCPKPFRSLNEKLWSVFPLADFFAESDSITASIERIKELLQTMPRAILIVMRYLFAFLNQWVMSISYSTIYWSNYFLSSLFTHSSYSIYSLYSRFFTYSLVVCRSETYQQYQDLLLGFVSSYEFCFPVSHRIPYFQKIIMIWIFFQKLPSFFQKPIRWL